MRSSVLAAVAALGIIFSSHCSAFAFCGPQDPFGPYDRCGPHQRYNGGGTYRQPPLISGPGTGILSSIPNPYPETGWNPHVAYYPPVRGGYRAGGIVTYSYGGRSSISETHVTRESYEHAAPIIERRIYGGYEIEEGRID